MKRNRELKHRIALWIAASLMALPFGVGAAGNGTVANTQLPTLDKIVSGGVTVPTPGTDNSLHVTQTEQNAVIKWNDFSIGANASVDFSRENGEAFNTLNYVTGTEASQIYGKLNAVNGNIYVVNPNGVQIGNSAQINVGSLYVSNQKMDDNALAGAANAADMGAFLGNQKTTDAELMSLGHIQAAHVTFVGNRIVIDTDRVTGLDDGDGNSGKAVLFVTSGDTDVVLGGDAKNLQAITVNGNNTIQDYQYQWITKREDLEAIGDNQHKENLNGQYALRNSIDLTDSAFTPIGSADNAFTGKLDGVGFSIFGLRIKNDGKDNTGLFGATDGASIGYLTLVKGTTDKVDVQGGTNTGSLIGYAKNTNVTQVTSTLNVQGTNNVGGLIGYAETTDATKGNYNNLINTGTVTGDNQVGGLIGTMNGGKLATDETKGAEDSETHNLGKVTGSGANVGGLVGQAENNATIGSTTGPQISNNAAITGGHNVGGIVGSMTGTKVNNVKNTGTVLAESSITGTYKYHSDEGVSGNDEKFVTANVQIANVGGIVGSAEKSQIQKALNQGDVSSHKHGDNTTYNADFYYEAGNVGGIVGLAEKTNITDVENKENQVRGAHNVGGIAGFFGTDDNDPTTTNKDTTVYTISHATNDGGDIMATGARDANGTVVTEQIKYQGVYDKENGVGDKLIVGNIGGIAGYMYGDHTHIQNSSNRGTVHSYDIDPKANAVFDSSKAADVGGIVGKIDQTYAEETRKDNLEAYLQAVKNGSIKAAVSDSYNTGDVRGYSNIGGVAGFMYNGEIINSYNLGNIKTTRTLKAPMDSINMGGVLGDSLERSKSRVVLYNVYNKGQIGDNTYQFYGRHVGGVAGRFGGIIDTAYNAGDIYNGAPVTGGVVGYWTGGTIQNVFNTGNVTLYQAVDQDELSGVGGIVGMVRGYTKFFNPENKPITNVFTLQNAYNLGSLRSLNKGAYGNYVSGILGVANGVWVPVEYYNGYKVNISNVYTTGNIFAKSDNKDLDHVHAVFGEESQNGMGRPDVQVTGSAYYIQPNSDTFTSLTGNALNGATSISFDEATVDHDNNNKGKFENFNTTDWRFYNGTTPILNAFMPLLGKGNNQADAELGDKTIQFGTAYNPFLNIFKVQKDQGDINLGGQYLNSWDSVAVYGGGLNVNGPIAGNADQMYGGTLYSDGALTISGHNAFSSASNLYGSSVDISTDGDLQINGDVYATGKNDAGNISIRGKSVETYGLIQSAKDGDTTDVKGLSDTADGSWMDGVQDADVNDPKKDMPTVESQYSQSVTAGNTATGNITVTAKDGDAKIYYGNMGLGKVASAGDFTVEAANGNILVESDMSMGGNMVLNGSTADGAEIVLDVSHIQDQTTFFGHFKQSSITMNNVAKGHALIAADGWNGTAYDKTGLQALKNNVDRLNVKGPKDFYVWIDDGEALKAAGDVADFNLALKKDIDASAVSGFTSIGLLASDKRTRVYSGDFTGRGNRILGLSTSKGLFDTVDTQGSVHDLKIYSSSFTGSSGGMGNAGAIAAVNKGSISDITGLGNTVSGTGPVGGLVGENLNGTISSSRDQSTVIGEESGSTNYVGGIAGSNNGGTIYDNQTTSAVIGKGDMNQKMTVGGIAGENIGRGMISNASSHGIAGGRLSSNVGGIVGTNTVKTVTADSGAVNGVYNDSIIRGKLNLGGVIGNNSGSVSDIANGADIRGGTNAQAVGGLVGTNSYQISSGRNSGTIDGTKYIGGLVGVNDGKDANLKDLENSPSAEITGYQYVGGIAGWNTKDATIDAKANGLTNEGKITGNQYVGGVAGLNDGTISNVDSNIVLHVTDGAQGKFFGGIAGQNGVNGTITGAKNTADVIADGADYVGGIAGRNDGKLQGASNSGNVTGKSHVGGVAGLNTKDFGDGDVPNDPDTNEAQKDMLIENSGNVTATAGGAGGVFGENKGNIGEVNGEKHIILSNRGNVTGANEDEKNDGTGGVIGVNRGTIVHTSLRNEVKKNDDGTYTPGSVTGTNNVGGVIGLNYGDVAGGRNAGAEKDQKDYLGNTVNAEAGSYYEYQILNNGKVEAEGNNAGGLIGKNAVLKDEQTGQTISTGKLTAGYNTGFVSGETNVGGIVGTNEKGAAVDQVFSTLMEGNTVTGTTSVGGVVGSNGGTLSNAYATDVIQKGANLVGTNTKNGQISNVYSSAASGQLIGANEKGGQVTNAYSFVENDTSATKVISGKVTQGDQEKDAQKVEASYDGFTFNTTNGWKIYDDKSNPLLKVFLTTVTVTNGQITDTYKGSEFTADYFRQHAGLSAANGKNFSENENTNGQLLHVKEGIIDAGKYKDIFYSQQIATDGKNGNPNNLGYDINVDLTVNQKELTVTGTDVERTYGNQTITKGHYGANLDGWVGKEEKADHSQDYRFDTTGIATPAHDGALQDGTNEKVTSDVGDYTWKGGKVELTNPDISKNYVLKTTEASGNSKVNQASLHIHANDTTVPVGVTPEYSGSVNGLVNGDAWKKDVRFGIAGADKPKESQVGVYHGIIGLWMGGTFHALGADDLNRNENPFLKNYNINVEAGTLRVVNEHSWDYFLKDAPWDRQRNFRERKAEIHFVAGGMTL